MSVQARCATLQTAHHGTIRNDAGECEPARHVIVDPQHVLPQADIDLDPGGSGVEIGRISIGHVRRSLPPIYSGTGAERFAASIDLIVLSASAAKAVTVPSTVIAPSAETITCHVGSRD